MIGSKRTSERGRERERVKCGKGKYLTTTHSAAHVIRSRERQRKRGKRERESDEGIKRVRQRKAEQDSARGRALAHAREEEIERPTCGEGKCLTTTHSAACVTRSRCPCHTLHLLHTAIFSCAITPPTLALLVVRMLREDVSGGGVE